MSMMQLLTCSDFYEYVDLCEASQHTPVGIFRFLEHVFPDYNGGIFEQARCAILSLGDSRSATASQNDRFCVCVPASLAGSHGAHGVVSPMALPAECDGPLADECDGPPADESDGPPADECDGPLADECDGPPPGECDGPPADECDGPPPHFTAPADESSLDSSGMGLCKSGYVRATVCRITTGT